MRSPRGVVAQITAEQSGSNVTAPSNSSIVLYWPTLRPPGARLGWAMRSCALIQIKTKRFFAERLGIWP